MINRHSSHSELISILLTVTVLAVSLPLYAFAMGRDVSGYASADMDAGNCETEIVEVNEKRTVSEKTFRLEDGNFYIAHYDTEIHEEDENGNLVDIDNRLYKNGKIISTKNGRYAFPVKTSDNVPMFTLSEKENSISFVLRDSKNGITGEIGETPEKDKNADRLELLTTLENVRSSVRYENVLPDTDIEYVVYGKNIKENIILKERTQQTEYVYSFALSAENLLPVLREDGQIDMIDSETGEVACFIPAPSMWDSAGEFSDAVFYELVPEENGTYALNIVVDAEWINDENRVFPVTVDPSVYSTASNVTDTFVSSYFPTTSYANSTTLCVCAPQRTYWKLNTLPSLPKSAYITDAIFTMRCYTTTFEYDCYAAVYDVVTDWDSTVTWNKVFAETDSAGQIASSFTDNVRICTYFNSLNGVYVFDNPMGAVTEKEFTWNVTPIVRKWFEGDNFGLAVAVPSGTSAQWPIQFRSNEYSLSSVRPSLCITYADMKGLEDYWSYASQDAGFAGTAYINNATGNLVVSIPMLSTTDSLLPVTLSLVYNHCMYFDDYKYPNVQTANTTAFTPRSFKLNINETLIKKPYTDASGNTAYYIVWADSDGTEHYFFPTSSEGTTYADEDGLHLTLTYSASECTITDSNDTVKTFTAKTPPSGVSGAWYLTSVTDKSGNKVTFALGSYNQPTNVYLEPNGQSSIEQLRIEYNSAKKPYLVWNPVTGEGVVLRYSDVYNSSVGVSCGNYLKNVVRAHVNTVSSSDLAKWSSFYNTNGLVSTTDVTVDAVAGYSYNYLGIMTGITNNLTGYKLSYNVYTASRKVSGCRESELTSSSNGQKIGYNYGTSYTTVRSSGTDDVYGNSDDLITTYLFDSHGRTVSCYTADLNNTRIYGATAGQYVGEEENQKAKNSLKSSVQTAQTSSNYILNGGFEEEANDAFAYWSMSGTIDSTPEAEALNHKAVALELNSSNASSSVWQTVSLPAGDYSLSADVFTYVYPDGVRAYLKAESLSNSSHSFIKEIPCNESNESGGVYSVSLDFASAPSITGGTEQFRITVLVEGSVSAEVILEVDNIMLSKTSGPAEYDLTSAGHFEYANSGILPTSFWKYEEYPNTPVSVVDSGIASFGKVLSINAPFTDNRCVSQTIYTATGIASNEYYDSVLLKVSGWAKGTGQSYSDGSLFDIALRVKYYNGSQYETRIYPVEFDRSITEWQFASGAVITEPGYGMINSIDILLRYKGHQGICYFDGIAVNVDSETVNSYEYGTNGYLSKATSGRNSVTYEYNDGDGNKPTKTVSYGKRTVTEYEYDASGRVISEKTSKFTGAYNPNTADNITELSATVYTYDTYGLVTEILCRDLVDGNIKTRTQIDYITSAGSHIFGAVNKETDALGNETKYFYGSGPDTGRLKAVINPESDGTCYTYDRMGNITEVLPAVVAGSTYYASYGSSDVIYGYDPVTKRLSTVTEAAGSTQATTYTFTYDNFGNVTETKAGSRTLASYTYNSENGKLNTLVYGNGLNVQYVYDELDRISEIKYRSGSSGSLSVAYTYTYTSAGYLHSVTDHLNGGEQTVYEYDSGGKPVSTYTVSPSGSIESGTSIYYDDENRVSGVFENFGYSVGSDAVWESSYYHYSYNLNTGNLCQLTYRGENIVCKINPVYDNLGRVNSKTVDVSDENGSDVFCNVLEYSYDSNGEYTSGRVSRYESRISRGENASVVSSTTYRYTYYPDGNISEIRDSNNVIQNKYYYDDFNRLTREDNRALNRTYVYYYDNAGNITQKEEYLFTTGTPGGIINTVNYTYGDSSWKDLLTKYNGLNFTYDSAGNPISAGGVYFSWRGRQLTGQMIGAGSISYAYNGDGVRTSKQYYNGSPMNSVTTRHEYTLDGNRTVRETVYIRSGMETTFTEAYTLVYIYDENGSSVGFRYRTPSMNEGVFENYFFEKTLQGDIISVYNESGVKCISYVYDAWGNVTETVHSSSGANAHAQYNPFRYRGYYYDTETGYYYLQSRYYNPVWGRFINPDGQLNDGLLGYNLFAYCEDNPVNYVDPEGESLIYIFVALLVVAAAPLVLSGCATKHEGTVYVNEYNADKGYYSGSDCDALAINMSQQIFNAAQNDSMQNEYGSVIYQFKEGNQYGEDPSNYWISPPHVGYNQYGSFIAKAWDPAQANLPDDINIMGDIHIHLGQAAFEANGGFSGRDIEVMMRQPGNYYVIVTKSAIVDMQGQYQVYKFDYHLKKGVKIYG